ncbi:MAG: hydroxyisourate hydrolase [Acidocella sp.]|nr:hydroxyisourate hydrolase [Acidocella sp.]
MAGGVTTHVLDVARGCGAAGMRVVLRGDEGDVFDGELEEGGRAALLAASALRAGTYEILFHAGDYQVRFGGPRFFDVISVRFNVTDVVQHHHVPLVLSPFGYSTYRGG